MATEFKEGDLVEAVKGESVVRGRARQGTGAASGYLFLGDSGAIEEFYVRRGWTVTLIDHPLQLPTEPGVYSTHYPRRADEGEWGYDGLAIHMLNTSGNWVDIGWGSPDKGATLTRLESRADTAKAVLERVSEILRGTPLPNEFSNLAREFGVQQ